MNEADGMNDGVAAEELSLAQAEADVAEHGAGGLDGTGEGELVTIARFEDHTEAGFARGALEAAGIPCFLQGENANSLLPMAFGTRLQVRASNEADARAVLAPAGDVAPGEVPAT